MSCEIQQPFMRKKINALELEPLKRELMNRVLLWKDRQIKYWDYRSICYVMLVHNEVKIY